MSLEDYQADIEELEGLLKNSTRQNVKKLINGLITDLKVQIDTLPVPSGFNFSFRFSFHISFSYLFFILNLPAAPPLVQNMTKTYVEVNNCGYDQEDGKVLLFWEIPNVGSVDKSNINTFFNVDSVICTVENLQGKNYRFTIGFFSFYFLYFIFIYFFLISLIFLIHLF
jgi:hypothetical protein